MSAWDDYPALATLAESSSPVEAPLVTIWAARAALNEVDRLRSELKETTWAEGTLPGITHDRHVVTVRATELGTVREIESANELLTEILAEEGVGHAADIRRVACEVGCSPAQALRMLVRYGVVRYDEFSDGPRTSPACVCGQPGAGTVHYTDKPCVKVEASEPG